MNSHLMASCFRNTCSKNRQNPLILFKVTIDNVGVPFFETQCICTSLFIRNTDSNEYGKTNTKYYLRRNSSRKPEFATTTHLSSDCRQACVDDGMTVTIMVGAVQRQRSSCLISLFSHYLSLLRIITRRLTHSWCI